MLELTRRSAFGLAGVGLVAAAGVSLSGSVASGAGPVGIPGRSAFLRGLRQSFSAVDPAGSRRVVLDQVLDLPMLAASEAELSFNLIFRSASGRALPEGLYRLTAKQVPVTDLWLSPVDRTPGVLQALVNRSVS